MGVGVGTGDCPSLTKKLELKKLILDVLCIHDYTNKKLEGGRKLEGDCQWMQELHWRKEGKYSYYIFTHGLKQILWAKLVNKKKQTLWPLFMDGVQLPKAKTTSRRQFTFYHSVPTNSWYSFYRLRKDERLSQPCSHPVVLNTGLLNWESST